MTESNTIQNEKENPLLENFPLFGIASLLYGIFFTFCLYKNLCSITSFFICIATILYYLFCFHALHIPMKKTDSFYFLCTLLLGLSNMLTQSVPLLTLNYCGIILLLFVYLIRHFYHTEGWSFSKYFSSLFVTMFYSTFHIADLLLSLRIYIKKKGSAKTSVLLSVLVGLVISIPLLFVILSLLISADLVFKDIFETFFSKLLSCINPVSFLSLLITACFGLCASFGILSELYKGRLLEAEQDKRVFEPVIAITFTSLLSIVYLVFSVIQILYLFLGKMTLPKGYTYANYAREGFFQLLFVCLINLALVLICMGRFMEHTALKGILTIICLCTGIMTASSFLRMGLYIKVYGLTFLRIFVLLSLFVISLCLFGVIISIYKKSFPLFSYMLVCVSVCYIIFSLAKPDCIIASYNIANTPREDGSTKYLYQLSLDAAPILVENGYFDDFTAEELALIGSWNSFPMHFEDYQNALFRDGKTMQGSYYQYNFANRSMRRYQTMHIRTFNLSAYQAGKAFERLVSSYNEQ